MQLFENDDVVISLDASVPCLEWIAKHPVTSETFRESELESLRFYRQYKAKYPALEGFVDARKMRSLLEEDVQWVANDILPKFETAGLTKEVFVMPEQALGRFVVKDYSEKSKSGKVTIRMFATVEEAKAWLKQAEA